MKLLQKINMFILRNINFMKIGVFSLSIALPTVVLAGPTGSFSCGKITDLTSILSVATCVMGKQLIGVLITAAMLLFFWGIIQYLINPGDEKKRAAGTKFILWGLMALFVMFAIYGLLNLISATLGIGMGGSIHLPQFSTK